MKLDSSSMVEALNRDQSDKLKAFEDLLRARAIRVGLVSARDGDRLMERHIADSLRASGCLEAGARRLVDMGSGAGLPGIPLAVAEPDREVVLVERKARAVAFLELVIQELGLSNVRVTPGSVESLGIRDADVCLARALAPPERAWDLATSLLGPTGYLVYWAGRRWSGPSAGQTLSAAWQICVPPLFSWEGPLVIMKRLPSPPAEERNDED